MVFMNVHALLKNCSADRLPNGRGSEERELVLDEDFFTASPRERKIMPSIVRRLCIGLVWLAPLAVFAQQSFTWEQIKNRFEASNPTLRAAQLNVDESRAQEITAYLRPNPDATFALDQFEPFNGGPYRPLSALFSVASFSYLHERQHKRELRLESQQKATTIAESQLEDQKRTLLFNLRTAFVGVLQASAILALAKENLTQYDHVLDVNRERKRAGDIAQVDLDRLELQRVQFESDLQTADVNVRTAKIQLLTLLNDRTPIDQFNVTGPFDFSDQPPTLEELRRAAMDNRPDLKAAVQSVDKAQTDHKLAVSNGSTDPTFGADFGRNPPLTNYVGFSVNIPLRIFDRNQGEKARTQLDIGRNERLRDAAEAQVFSDVDSAYATLSSTVALLRPYKNKYLQIATSVRTTISYAFQRGGSSLLDFLQAQQDYRAVNVTYLNLIGSYLTAAGQLNMAVGREVIQ
jgi:cobalt-zinc-cadmium efflux system outer membrane protein